MSGTAIEWLIVILFLGLFVAVLIAETLWLIRKRWTTPGKAIAYVTVSNFVGIGIGSGVVLTVMLLMLMMTLGPAGRGPTSDMGTPMILALIAGVIVPPLVLIVLKRLCLKLFNIESGRKAWVYSVVSSILSILITLLPPPLIYVLFANLSKWRS